MYLTKHLRAGKVVLVFTAVDPRNDGFVGDIEDSVSLEFDMNQIFQWEDGEVRPCPVTGKDPNNPKNYRVFRFSEELSKANYEKVSDLVPLVSVSWSDSYIQKGIVDLAE